MKKAENKLIFYGKKEIGKLVYNGETYWSLELIIDGAYNFFAEEALLDAIEKNNECGCGLDNEIVFYPTRNQLTDMFNFAIADDIDGLKKYLQSEEIFYYKLEEGKLVGGIN
jgi:hypothetical protein